MVAPRKHTFSEQSRVAAVSTLAVVCFVVLLFKTSALLASAWRDKWLDFCWSESNQAHGPTMSSGLGVFTGQCHVCSGHWTSCCGWHPGRLQLQLCAKCPHKNTIIKPSGHIGKAMKGTFMAPKVASAWKQVAMIIWFYPYFFLFKAIHPQGLFLLIHRHTACGAG